MSPKRQAIRRLAPVGAVIVAGSVLVATVGSHGLETNSGPAQAMVGGVQFRLTGERVSSTTDMLKVQVTNRTGESHQIDMTYQYCAKARGRTLSDCAVNHIAALPLSISPTAAGECHSDLTVGTDGRATIAPNECAGFAMTSPEVLKVVGAVKLDVSVDGSQYQEMTFY
jgi:hypothetical protein